MERVRFILESEKPVTHSNLKNAFILELSYPNMLDSELALRFRFMLGSELALPQRIALGNATLVPVND